MNKIWCIHTLFYIFYIEFGTFLYYFMDCDFMDCEFRNFFLFFSSINNDSTSHCCQISQAQFLTCCRMRSFLWMILHLLMVHMLHFFWKSIKILCIAFHFWSFRNFISILFLSSSNFLLFTILYTSFTPIHT